MADNHDSRPTIASSDAEDPHEGDSDIVGEVSVELIRDDASDVISLDDLIELAHGA